MIIRYFFVVVVTTASFCDSAKSLEMPVNAVSMFNAPDKRMDWWSKNFKNVESRPRNNCYFNQGDSGYDFPCRLIFRPEQIIRGEEKDTFVGNSPEMVRYRRDRSSLYENPVPVTPHFLMLRADRRTPVPLASLIDALKRDSLDRKTALFRETFYYQWGWNISYEQININEALSAGWDYYERAANQDTLVCDKSLYSPDMLGSEFLTSECLAVVRLTSSGSKVEPENFARGVALCYTDRQRKFYFGCSLVTMETKVGRRYIKAMVGPPMGMGGGAFVNDFGRFTLTCRFAAGAAVRRLSEVKQQFGFGSIFQLDRTILIDAATGFRYFEKANKWGMVMMQTRSDLSESEQIRFVFQGKWGNQNTNDNHLPLFLDPDVETFKRLFEDIVGRGKCEKESSTIPTITQS